MDISSVTNGGNFQSEPLHQAYPAEDAAGLMRGLIHAMDWAKTPLGLRESWSPALKMMANFMLSNRFPQLLWWGPQFCCIYNDAYIPILGTKHPWALGRPVSEVWGEIWHVLKPLIETPFHGGPATWMEDLPLEINRRGFFEETHFTVAYSPVPDESAPGGIGGVLATVHEITDKVIAERRVHALRELGSRSTEPKSAEDACELVGKTLSSFTHDIPFFLFYLSDENQQAAKRVCHHGVEPHDRGCPESIELSPQAEQIWPLYTAYKTEDIQLVENLKDKFDMPPRGPWSDEPFMAAVVPIRSNMQHQLAGFLIAGVSSRIPFDDRYRDFLELMSTQITTIIENARAYDLERKRSVALTELRLKAEAAEQQYRGIVESISEGFLFIDRNWQVRYVNQRWATFAGTTMSDTIGRNLWQMFPGLEDTAFGHSYLQVMKTQKSERVEEFYAPLGRWFRANIYPSSEGISIFVDDVTERRLQQERLLLSEKLAATGRLAATIAHEINNPLESVLNLIYLARTSRDQADKIEEFLSTAEKEVTRVSHIARHTLGFYRESSLPAQIDMRSLLEEVLTVYHSRLRAGGIEIHKNFADVPTIKALRGEMHQVFSNLISNAIDAMREGGKLTMTVLKAEAGGKAGVEVRIADTGIGVPPENLPRLFEAFFTTKPSAGTGLGLWVVKRFIDSWHGAITITSTQEPGSHGTTFTIFLPLEAVSQAALSNEKSPAVV